MEKIFSSAAENPSARSSWDCLSPSAIRIFDCFWPCAQDRGLLLSLSHIDRGFTCTCRPRHLRPPNAFRRHLAVHRVLDLARRDDLPDLDIRHLDPPSLSDFVELCPQNLIDVFALG